MSENKNLSKEEQEFIGKNISFYETFLNAWVQNRMEKDKSVLTLSSLAIGLLVTFLAKNENTTQFVFWILSTIFFVISIIINLLTFHQNSDYIQEILQGTDKKKQESLEKKLNTKTFISFALFIVGIILTFSLAIMQSGFTIIKI